MNLHLLRGVFSGLIADLAGYVRGSVVRGGAAGWEVYDAKTAGQILVGDGADIRSVAVDGDATLIGILDIRYLKLDASNDPVTAGLEINAATTTEPVLILQTMDDNTANPILEIQNAAGAMLSEIEKDGNLNFTPACAANPGMIEINDTRFLHTYGTLNLFVGLNAGNFALTGQRNIGVGFQALDVLTTANGCIAAGYQALTNNLSGSDNCAIGSWSLTNNTTGFDNMAIGTNALRDNTTGQQNVAIGVTASVLGITGNANVAIGAAALRANIAGGQNVAVGAFALYDNTGGENIAIGGSALMKNTTAIRNVGIGAYAGRHNQAGHYNVFMGCEAGRGTVNHNKTRNVMIGYRAGALSLAADYNVLIGFQAGDVVTTGDYNIVIGYDIDPTGAAVSNELNIGALIYGKLDTKRGGINVTPPNLLATWHLDQSVSDAAIPVLILDQADISEGFINFIGSDRGVIAGATNSIGSVRAEINGTVYRLALYADA